MYLAPLLQGGKDSRRRGAADPFCAAGERVKRRGKTDRYKKIEKDNLRENAAISAREKCCRKNNLRTGRKKPLSGPRRRLWEGLFVC